MKRIRVASVILSVLFLLAGCVKTSDNFRYKREGDIFGTISLMYIYDDFSTVKAENRLESVWNEAEELLQTIENAVSVSVKGSDIYNFNEIAFGESVKISSVTAEIFLIAKEAYKKSGGIFDPTVYPLVDLWGFSPRFAESSYVPTEKYDRTENSDGSFSLPSEKYIEAFRSLVGFDKVELSGNETDGYYLKKNIEPVTVDGVTYQGKIDFGGIAKGYAADKIINLMKQNGYYKGYFSCGRSSIAFLENGGKSATDGNFDLKITKPRTTSVDGETYAKIKIKNASVSSSGDYEKYYVVDGKTYCHVIDAKSGYPIHSIEGENEKIIAATLIGDDAGLLDALSTATLAMTLSDAKKFLSENDVDGIICFEREGKLFVYTTLKSNEIEIEDENYILEK